MVREGKKNPNYRHGRYVENRCANCNELIDARSTYCYQCRATLNPSFKGKHHTKKTKKNIGTKSRLKFTPKYKKEHYQDKFDGNKKRAINGYILIKNYCHPNRNSRNDILEHILVMSQFLGRPLNKGEIVHHIDGDRTNNNISNLYLYANRSKHAQVRSSLYRLVKPLLKKGIIVFDAGEYKLKKEGSSR